MSDGFSLWQLPEQTQAAVMSYILRTRGGITMVIDGGTDGDAEYLRELVRGMGNVVDVWFVSHPHEGHVGALTSVLRAPGGLAVRSIRGSLPAVEWVQEHASAEEAGGVESLLQAAATAGVPTQGLEAGETFRIDGVHFEVLGAWDPGITRNALNNASLVLRVSDEGRSVLFPGDLLREGARKLLSGPFSHRLPSIYCQMAHHGLADVGEEFYQAVRPTHCLWPTPLWLYENDGGGGRDTGPWSTLLTRAWMHLLPVSEYILAGEGMRRIG